jgi:hypothetical protein
MNYQNSKRRVNIVYSHTEKIEQFDNNDFLVSFSAVFILWWKVYRETLVILSFSVLLFPLGKNRLAAIKSSSMAFNHWALFTGLKWQSHEIGF